MLSPKVAQSIVDRTMAVLGVQVNIMDADAVVIASGNPQRIGKYHGGAAKVLRTGKKLSVSCGEASRMEGVKPGITLPISFKGKIIGAVGMTGEPEEVEAFGELLKLTAELMLDQASVKEQGFLERRAREGFFTDLLTGHWQEYEWYFLHRAELLSYDLKKSHVVMAVELLPDKSDLSWYEEPEKALSFQKRKAGLEERIAAGGFLGGKLISCFINGEMAVLYQVPAKVSGEFGNLAERAARHVASLLKESEEPEIMVGVGGIAEDWREISRVYGDAKSALHMSRIFQREDEICFYDYYLTEHMLSFVPQKMRRQYWKRILGPVLNAGEDHRDQYMHTMQTYFENGMNSVQTAERLFLHRNTLMFRLNKIKEITGLQPQKFQDAVKLKLAMLLMKMDEDGAHNEAIIPGKGGEDG